MWNLKATNLFSGIIALFFVSSAVCQNSSLYGGSQYKLVWTDEFNGKELDHRHWSYETGCNGWGNNELQCYKEKRHENVRLEHGKLIIQARPEGNGFTSGRIVTKNSFKYGRFEARAKLPAGHHLWPAIWMLPTKNVYGTWAASGEIDIMEARGDDPHTISGTIHYGGQWPNNIYTGSGDRKYEHIDFSQGFHVFAVEWTHEHISWFLDGNKFHEENINRMMWSGKGNNPYHHNGQPFDQEFHFVINLAVGGNFFGPGPYVSPAEAKHWKHPQLELEWLRVFQKK